MRAFVAHLWKEWREHRLMLGAIGAAIVLLTAGVAWAFSDRVFQLERGSPFYVAACTALTVFALSTELFAAEGRRDGFGFLRRLPRGLGTAFAAKVVFYVLACALTAAFGAATLLLVTQVAGGALAVQELRDVLQAFDSYAGLVLPACVVTLGLWILCISLWIPRGAAAAGAALLLVGALGTPVWLALSANPAFQVPDSWILGAAIGVFLVPAVAAAWGLLRGLRFARSSWSAAWRGIAIVFAAALPAYAAGNARLARWNDLQADEPNLESLGAVIARGGAFAYVNLARKGETYLAHEQHYGQNYFHRRPLTRAFRVDLRTGRAIPISPLGAYVTSGASQLGAYSLYGDRTAGLVAVVRLPDEETVTWWDAVRGEPIKTLPADVVTDVLVDRMRADLRAASPVRLRDGRPVWIFKKKMEHQDEREGVVSFPLPDGIRINWSDAFGWMVWEGPQGKVQLKILMPDDEGRPVLLPWQLPGEWDRVRLSIDRYLTRQSAKAPWALVEGERRSETTAFEPRDTLFARIDESHVLTWRRIDSAHSVLMSADLAAGTSSPVSLPEGTPDLLQGGTLVAMTPAGQRLLRLTALVPAGEVVGYALLDPAGRNLRSWTPAKDWDPSRVTVLDETTLIEDDGNQLVRRTLGTGASEVLFPRR